MLLPALSFPQHHDWISFAGRAYAGWLDISGSPGSYYIATSSPAYSMLQQDVDLVFPNNDYMSAIDAVAPATPQLSYSNIT